MSAHLPLRLTAVAAAVWMFALFGATNTAGAVPTSEFPDLALVEAGDSQLHEALPLEDGEAPALAKSLGITEDEVVARFRGQYEFLTALTTAKEKWRERYSDSAWEASGTNAAWVSFTGPVDEEIVAAFKNVPVGVELRFNARISENKAEDIKQHIIELMADTGRFVAIEGSADPTSGSIQVRYQLKPGAVLSPPERRSLLDDLRGRGAADISVEESIEDISSNSEALRGGTALTSCTTGFTIRIHPSSPVKHGILNAAHCANNPGKPTGSAYSLNFEGQHVGNYGEIQKLRSGDPVVHNHIRVATNGEVRFIQGTAFPSKGASICNYGKTRSAYACTTVRATGLSFWTDDTDDYGSKYVGRMAQSNGSFTAPGDSGGPWFSGTLAIGVHYGKHGGYSTFSTVPDAMAVLGVSVLTS